MRKKAFLSMLPAFVMCACIPTLYAQNAARSNEEKRAYLSAMVQADQKISEEVKAHSELMKNLEYLTLRIGARLTGSTQMQEASDWTLKRFRDYGIDGHLETAQVAHAWVRGNDTAEITAPVKRAVGIHAAGWSRSTDGPVTAPVVVLEAGVDPETYKGKLKGAIVLAGKPAEVPTDIAENAYDAVITPQRGVPRPGNFADRRRLMGMVAEEHAAVLLQDSGKTDSLFNMTGAGRYEPSQMPVAFITHEDYDAIYRLSRLGAVTMTISITGAFSAGPAPASITVAEIKGEELPDERVIIGGHLDSWDLGQGALDNGTGSMAVLEAARTLKALGWKPKRTITFILFTGEEQGGIGVQTFMKNHAAEVPKMDATLIHDTGTGRVFSIALENLYETAPLMTEIYEPLREVFELQPLSTRFFGGSDHLSFLRAGVPAYFCVQNPAHYREAHHSQTDTFDKVIPEEINQGAALLAAWAWNVSQMPVALPHHAAGN